MGVSASCLALGIGPWALGEVGDQGVNEPFLLLLAVHQGAADGIRYVLAFLQVLVEGHQHLVVFLQQYTDIRQTDMDCERQTTLAQIFLDLG